MKKSTKKRSVYLSTSELCKTSGEKHCLFCELADCEHNGTPTIWALKLRLEKAERQATDATARANRVESELSAWQQKLSDLMVKYEGLKNVH